MRSSILILLAVIVLVGCGKDDPTIDTKLVGTWTGVSSTTEMIIDGKTYKEYLMETVGLSEDDANTLVDMMNNALTLTGFFTELEVKADGTWHGVTDFQGTHVDVSGNWTLSADQKTLTLTDNLRPGVAKSATILKLDDTDLWLEIIPTADELPPGTPTNMDYKVTAKLVRKK